MKLLTEHEWRNKYIPTNINPIKYKDIPEETSNSNVWTLVERNNSLSLVAGFVHLNRLGYYLTKNTHKYDVEVYL